MRKARVAAWGAGAAAVLLLALVPALGTAYLTDFIFLILVSFALAQSWDWIGGEMGYINLGHLVYYGVGAYTFSILLVGGAPLPVSFAAAVAFTGVLAALLSFPLFRLKGDYFAFGTLALLPLAELLAYNLSSLTNGATGITLPPRYALVPAYEMALALAAVALLVTGLLASSRFGYALNSIRNDEQAAEIVGIRLLPAKLKVMVLSAGFAALAGAIQAWQLSFIDPSTVFGLAVALVPIAMALLGGSGLMWGPLVGVVLLSASQQLLLVHVPILQATIYGVIIVLIGRYMPGGLLRAAAVRRLPLLGRLGRQHHERSSVALGAGIVLDTVGLPLAPLVVDRAKNLLECRGLTKAFGGNIAVDGIDLTIHQGEVVGLVGSNGSGKTTLFNCISKVYEPNAGKLLFDGRNLRGLRRDEVSRLGVGRTYQIPRPFADLTVLENVATALLFRTSRAGVRDTMTEAAHFAAFAGLETRFHVRADSLTLQEKKALELARALACRPKLLLIDEVASGLTPAEVKNFIAQIREVRDIYGITVIWVEHIFWALAQIVDRLVVLDHGALIANGPLAETMQDDRVLTGYLGAATPVRYNA